MIHFAKLRLSGFKSFVDKTELEISPGLNGIVGPNGCGKSNLVEALRWVMGENRAKNMRTGDMDDVIFNGTSSRPARNIAEVSLLLDNNNRTAPSAYNDNPEIEVSRRIERDKGSDYRINGKSVRARDVQLLFADTHSGAHSPALVSQGRITAIITAKPIDRRQILEESAGISGLHARRHEAELRLRAADNNLIRLNDVIGGLETQLSTLKRQSRQATRYRELSESIRELETKLAALEWHHLQLQYQSGEARFHDAEKLVATHMQTVAQLTTTQITQASDIPALRQKEAEAAAALQVQNLTLQRLADEEAMTDRQLSDARAILEQIKIDVLHENETLEDNTRVSESMNAEESALHKDQELSASRMPALKDDQSEKQSHVDRLEASYQIALEAAASLKARRVSLEQQVNLTESKLQNSTSRITDIQAQLVQRAAEREQTAPLGTLQFEIQALENQIQATQNINAQAKLRLTELRAQLEGRRDILNESKSEFAKNKAEIDALQSFLDTETQGSFRPVLDEISADMGFEDALAKALGDALMASTNANAEMVWQRLTNQFDAPAFPQGVEAISNHVRAPAELARAISLIGYVTDKKEGEAAAQHLKAGQIIVSRDGFVWRWDGLFIKPSANDRKAIMLKQKNRLDDLRALTQNLSQSVQTNESFFIETQNALSALDTQIRIHEQDIDQNTKDLSEKRRAHQLAIEQSAALSTSIAKLEEAQSYLQTEITSLQTSLTQSKESYIAIESDPQQTEAARIDTIRAALVDAQTELRDAMMAVEKTTQEQQRREARLRAIADERINIQNRTIRAREHLKNLAEREEQTHHKILALQGRPAEIRASREAIMSSLAQSEGSRNIAADILAKAENELAETLRALKEAESKLSSAREDRARTEATLEGVIIQQNTLKSQINEQFSVDPNEIMEKAGINQNAESQDLPQTDDLRARKEKLVRDRDHIGPVNLRADVEAQEIEQQVGGMITERDDLTQAIAELREGINKLNKEARERLLAAFETVNHHFQTLFTRLFNGGRAYLALQESDDPLQSGLEVFAQPPGKTLQNMSLLSGGEQTLAATALIFAMFLTNPSPICVLDEIDAPLDDANVDRVCDLLEDIAKAGTTRFIIITHHRLTMARMDKLYGVTMSERGVSQLVSVDLKRQMDLLQQAAE